MTHARGPLALLILFVLLALWGMLALQNGSDGPAPEGPEGVVPSRNEEAQEMAARASEQEGERELFKDTQAEEQADKQGPAKVAVPRKKLTFTGQVHHAGQGIGSAKVHLVSGSTYRRSGDKERIFASARTDARGRFELSYETAELSRWSRFALVARASGYTPAEELVIYGARSFGDLKLELFPDCQVKGVVLDPRMQPVESAEIHAGIAGSGTPSRLAEQEGLAWRPLTRASVKTDKEGRFQLVLPSNKDWSITATAEEGRCELSRAASAERRVELRLQLVKPKAPAKVRIWGFTRDEGGTLRSDIAVKILEGNDWRGSSVEEGSQTNQVGRFEFTVRAGSDCTLYVGGQDFEVRAHPLGKVLVDTGPVLLNLRRGLSIRGHLLGADGKAMAQAVVELGGDPILAVERLPPLTLLSAFGKVRVHTDAEGRFEFNALARSRYWVQHREQKAPFRVAKVHVAAGNHEVRLQMGVVQGPAVEIQGRLLDALTMTPIAGQRLEASRIATHMRFGSGSYGVATAMTDARGAFVLRGLEAAEYELSFAADGYAPARLAARFYKAGKHVVQLQAWPKRSLSVVVLDLLGRPVHRARVYVIDAQGKKLMISTGGGGATSPGQTDKEGRLNMHGLPAQTLRLEVEPTFWQESVERSVDLVPAQPQTVQVELKVVPGGKQRTLTLALRDKEQQPIRLGQGCDVTLEDLQGRRITGIPIRRNKQGQLQAMVGAFWMDKTVKQAVLRLSVPRTAFRARVVVAGYQDCVLQFPAGKQPISEQATLR